MRLNRALGLSFTQTQVDFVIPDVQVDTPLAIDPFLLFKSRSEDLRFLHDQLISLFNRGIKFYRENDLDSLQRLIQFPEVDEVAFGYSEGKIKGSGLGSTLNQLLADTLASSPDLRSRGLRHVEELQLLSVGVGPDRISDIAGNVLKIYLIEYTQKQAELWSIPVSKQLPINHSFDFDDWTWTDGYYDLPMNPESGMPILLVPRRIVRLLPWINYDDYARTEFRSFLQPSRGPRLPRYPGMPMEKRKNLAKAEVIDITRHRLDIVDSYIGRKVTEAAKAEPALGGDQVTEELANQVGDDLIARLQTLPVGQASAADYQRVVYEIFNYLFEPELTDGRMEERTHHGTERRDVIYTNESEHSFLKYVREQYSSMLLLLEVKNVKELEIDHINQVSAYLGARLGMLGIIVTRNAAKETIILKTYSIFNDTPSVPRKVILVVSDDQLIAMIRAKQLGDPPVKTLQQIYRTFKTRLQ